jgi:uncharacterized membrane protein
MALWRGLERGRALSFLSNHWRHHNRFYLALLPALLAYAVAREIGEPAPLAVAVDLFFVAYLVATAILAIRLDGKELDHRADIEDEGAFVVFLITLVAVVTASVAVFVALNRAHSLPVSSLLLILAGAPLGWIMLHTVSAFHYANRFYAAPDNAAPLLFPGTGRPNAWDFLYFSLTIGMTAQVSDVQVTTSAMRRTVLVHSFLSFFFNTVLLVMAVNAVLALADTSR